MSEDIPALIAYARNTQEAVNVATVLRHGMDDGSHLIDRLADALEAEHQQATKWQKLWEKAANGVLSLQAERDALRAAIQNARLVIKNKADTPALTIALVSGILSRAIDTKEQS